MSTPSISEICELRDPVQQAIFWRQKLEQLLNRKDCCEKMRSVYRKLANDIIPDEQWTSGRPINPQHCNPIIRKELEQLMDAFLRATSGLAEKYK